MLSYIRDRLIHPEIRGYDPDSIEFSLAHREILKQKFILRELYKKFYTECRNLDLRYFADCPGKRLELGSESGFIANVYPDVITSDIKCLPSVNIVMDAQKMPFQSHSLRAIYAINLFHHLTKPRRFFKEILRVVYPGGGVILIDPFYGPFARFVYRNLLRYERYDTNVTVWESLDDRGPFSNANQALSYIVFKRDYEQFKREFPNLEMVYHRPHTHLSYILSGGVNFRQLIPNLCLPLITLAEKLLSPLKFYLALFHTIVLRKKS